MHSLEEALDRYDDRARRVGDVDAFFRQHVKGWRKRAAAAVRATGRALRPDEIEPEQWERYLDQLADLVRAWIVVPGEEGAGVDIELRLPVSKTGQATVQGPITMAMIREWVAAGAEGDPAGKWLDERDQGKDPDEVATQVWFALRQGAMSGQSIRDFIQERTNTGPDGHNLLDAIIRIWLGQLTPIIARDWRGWVKREMHRR